MGGQIALASQHAGRRLMIAGAALVVVLDVAFVVTLAIHRFGPEITELKRMFDLGREANVPTWANTMLLLAVAATLFLVAGLSRPDERPSRRSLVVAGVVAALLSIDEAAELHELAGAPTAELLDRWGVALPTYSWVVPGVVVGVVLAAAAWRWSRMLPDLVRRRLTLALGMYFGAALGVEAINGWLVRRDAEYPYAFGTLVEESMEMAACIVALTGLVALLEVADGAIRRRDTPAPSSDHGLRREGGGAAASSRAASAGVDAAGHRERARRLEVQRQPLGP